ncbi:methionine adenosyltransferase [Anaerotalea alkaliphila]|uniref:S-adenosylmethionine synthase n=1 Tax=Anaerotalea alkaliphila TaxID=2662126 RepID=A0A7X5HXV2_9FIRM|nr:methionine adenosyltransferase [Anaerotalea alkaliphila]NDL68620.1 methionine adenosyltransferase [Anaerotalea alkaliphila]
MKENQKPAYVFTSESVTEGHPDKLCDQIADAIMDAILREDPEARTAIEVTAADGLIHVFGETSTEKRIDYKKIVKDVIYDIGYRADELSTDGEFYRMLIAINKQSPDIAMGVDKKDIGAGDQGMMFGYATDETEELMPLTMILAHKLCMRLAEVRKAGELSYLKPDGKAQVSLGYGKDNKPLSIEAIVVSTQHSEGVDIRKLREDVTKHIILKVIPHELLTENTKLMINPTGRFVLGGPAADSGLTGRKIIVDTYGSKGRHGGGAFSGKDATKVDRSGAYLARYIAKNIVAAGLARECEVQVSYAIGVAKPVSFKIDTFGTSILPDEVLTEIIKALIDMRPGTIIKSFGLRRPIYRQFAVYGHFGREKMTLDGVEKNTPWEMKDLVPILKDLTADYLMKKGESKDE